MLKVQNISFSYLNTKTLRDINFSIESSSIVAIIGESGCGKSTLLKLIYGLYDLDEGQIFWNENEVLGPKFHLIPGMDFMKYLAQDFDLMPFITVSENVGKFLSNVNFIEKQKRINEVLEVVEMKNFATTKAKNLSGGQMQRVALAKVLALEPQILLLDEPFSHIDNFRKNSLRRNIFAYAKEKKITILFATHDSTDVLSFADEVIVMKDGLMLDKIATKDCYENPKSKYVASLFGDVNEISSTFFNTKSKIPNFIYPHQLKVVAHSKLKVIVKNNYYRGSHHLVEAEIDSKIIFFESNISFIVGSIIFLELVSNELNN
ncbi:MAG: ABC transporter ATP-binding protein [Flavobacterium sp.]|nr:ABC transporter ATP-binding protein [Flavobacterium sp.]